MHDDAVATFNLPTVVRFAEVALEALGAAREDAFSDTVAAGVVIGTKPPCRRDSCRRRSASTLLQPTATLLMWSWDMTSPMAESPCPINGLTAVQARRLSYSPGPGIYERPLFVLVREAIRIWAKSRCGAAS